MFFFEVFLRSILFNKQIQFKSCVSKAFQATNQILSDGLHWRTPHSWCQDIFQKLPAWYPKAFQARNV